MRDPSGTQRVGERPHQRLLADQLGEPLRPMGARQDPIGLAALTEGRGEAWVD